MGTWGFGNFESDAALDFVDEQIDRFVAIITEVFADEQRSLLDEDAEGQLMPSVEILILLCEHSSAALPKEIDVAAWKRRYLELYDAQIDGLSAAPGYKEARRAVIESTFDRLLPHQR
jgi:hypothetical protein